MYSTVVSGLGIAAPLHLPGNIISATVGFVYINLLS